MGFYERQVLPRIVDLLLGTSAMGELRARLVAPLRGDVVELGFGSGLNLPHLPPSVARLYAVDPSVVGRHLAGSRLAASPVPVDFVGLDGAALDLPDDSVDAVLSTFTLCTIPDVDRALAEALRVLRPGGTLHLLEHGRHPDPRVERRQHRFEPVQRRIAGGCHLTREPDRLVAAAGFTDVDIAQYGVKGPKVGSWFYEGTARRP